MLSNFSSNALMAKSRAMYGNRLTAKNYADLLNCHTVNEIAAYLKSHTAYADILEGSAGTSIHRGQLESLLKKRLFNQYASLCHYEMSIGQEFYQYFIFRGDVEQILRCIMLMRTGQPGDYLLSMPAFFNKQSKLDLYALAEVTSLSELLKVLANSPYFKVLEPFVSEDITKLNVLLLESAFNRYLYEELGALAQRGFRGKRREELLDFLRLQIDSEMIVKIYRLKHLFNADENATENFVTHHFSKMSKAQVKSLMQANSADDMLKRLQATGYGKYFTNPDFQYIEDPVQEMQYEKILHQFRFSANPCVVMLCYTVLAENEINNIIHMIEGIRYQVSQDVLSKMLIGVGD